MQGNPFADLIPQQSNQGAQFGGGNPFDDLIPEEGKARMAQQRQELQAKLDAYNNGDQMSQENMSRNPADAFSWPKQAAKHAVAILGQAGNSLINIPNKLTNGAIPGYETDYDYYNAMGVEKNVLDAILQGAIEFAPYLTGAGGMVKGGASAVKGGAEFLAKNPWKTAAAQNTLAGLGYGAVEGKEGEKTSSALKHGGLGVLSAIGGGAFEKGVVKPLMKSYANSSLPALLEKGIEKLKGGKKIEDQIGRVKEAHDKTAALNKAEWTDTENLAAQIDKGLRKTEVENVPTKFIGADGKPLTVAQTVEKNTFDNSSYTGFLKDYLKNYKKMEKVSKADYKDAAEFAQHALKNLPPESFTSAVALRQNLNRELKKFLDQRNIQKPDKYTEDLVKDLKNNLINKTLPANKDKVAPELYNQFTKTWEKANETHQRLQGMYEGVEKGGNLVNKRILKNALEQDKTPDAAIMTEYLPKPNQTGTASYEQLAKTLGSKEEAQKLLQAHYIRKPLENGSSAKDVAAIYGGLSDAQRDYVFGKGGAKKFLDIVNEARLRLPKNDPKWMPAFHEGIAFGVPGAVGFGAGLAEGMPWEDAFKQGAMIGLGSMGAKALGAKMATPASVRKALNRYEKGGKNQGKLLNTLLQTATSGDQE